AAFDVADAALGHRHSWLHGRLGLVALGDAQCRAELIGVAREAVPPRMSSIGSALRQRGEEEPHRGVRGLAELSFAEVVRPGGLGHGFDEIGPDDRSVSEWVRIVWVAVVSGAHQKISVA